MIDPKNPGIDPTEPTGQLIKTVLTSIGDSGLSVSIHGGSYTADVLPNRAKNSAPSAPLESASGLDEVLTLICRYLK